MTPSLEQARQDLLRVYAAALKAVDGRVCVKHHLAQKQLEDPLYLIAMGKAACAMSQGALDSLGDRLRDACIITKHGYAQLLPWPVHSGGHPLPDSASLKAGEHLLQFIQQLPPVAEVLCLLSGGASAVVENLAAGIDLTTLQQVNRWLLSTGQDIASCNRVRKRLSQIKGGRLAQLLAPRRVTCLAISDVPGDDPAVLASGPLSPASAADRLPDMPPGLPLAASLWQRLAPLPSAQDSAFAHIDWRLIANLAQAQQAAAQQARALGYRVVLHPACLQGDAVARGRELAQTLLSGPVVELHIWGGETTVVLPPQPGRGGRCQSLALAAAMRLDQNKQHVLLAGASDGSDGPGDDAGALVDDATVMRAADTGLDGAACLAAADAGSFLEASGDLLHTGPTGTNVMDIILGLKLA